MAKKKTIYSWYLTDKSCFVVRFIRIRHFFIVIIHKKKTAEFSAVCLVAGGGLEPPTFGL